METATEQNNSPHRAEAERVRRQEARRRELKNYNLKSICYDIIWYQKRTRAFLENQAITNKWDTFSSAVSWRFSNLCPTVRARPFAHVVVGEQAQTGDLPLDRLARKLRFHSLEQHPHFFKQTISRLLPAGP